MRFLGTLLVWGATIFGLLVAANLGGLVKRYIVFGREWDIASLAILFHVFLLLAAWGLYRAGKWCKHSVKAA
jgi:hypothetical protein